MPPKAQQQLAAIGQIRGRISWQSGQLPSIDVSKPDVSSVIKNIRIQAVKITPVPSSGPGDLGSTKVEKIAGSFASSGPVQINGNTRSVTYAVSKLPLDSNLGVLIASPPDGGNFAFTGNAVTVNLKLTDSVANGFDFVYVPA
jgi:hypothetical protein